MGEFWGVMQIFFILVMVVVIQTDICVKFIELYTKRKTPQLYCLMILKIQFKTFQ